LHPSDLPLPQGVARNRAVELAGVEMGEAVMRSDQLAEGAFAGGRRSVNGDDHAN